MLCQWSSFKNSETYFNDVIYALLFTAWNKILFPTSSFLCPAYGMGWELLPALINYTGLHVICKTKIVCPWKLPFCLWRRFIGISFSWILYKEQHLRRVQISTCIEKISRIINTKILWELQETAFQFNWR